MTADDIDDKMVMYVRARQIVELGIWMQGSDLGVSLEQIEEEFGVGVRTAQRMRDAVEAVWGELRVRRGDDGKKRWSAPILNRVPQVTAEQLAHLAAAAELMRAQARPEAAKALNEIRARITPAYGAGVLRHRLNQEFEALTELEGLATRPGPRVRYDPDIRQSLRKAILDRRVVHLNYRLVGTGREESRTVEPYGFLHGTRSYLVAYSRTADGYGWRNLRLSNVLQVETGDRFERDPDFSLEKYAGRSFGVFQEEPFDVVWKFNPAAAESAREFQFHPDQRTEALPDGSLLVKFRAGGAREMSWHLYSWGDTVEVIEPEDFWERLERG